MFEPNDEAPEAVDVNTDDLDAFSDLFSGKAKEKTEDTPDKEEVKPDDVDPVDSDTADKDDDPEDKPEEVENKEKPKKVNRVQERINELLAREREAKEAANELQRKLDELASKPAPKAAVPVQDDGPNPDDTNSDGSDKYPLGEFDPQYIRDLTRHTIQKEQAAAREQEDKARATKEIQEARDSLHNKWTEKLTPFSDEHEDFLDKTMELETAFTGLDPQYSDYLAQTIKSLDHGPEVLYYFANNLDEAQKFVKMGPLAATLALGEYNAMFKGQTRQPPKVSNAPPPPQVNKGSKTRVSVSGDTDDLDAFAQMFFNKKKG